MYQDSCEPIRLKLVHPARSGGKYPDIDKLSWSDWAGAGTVTDLNIYITASLALNHPGTPDNSDGQY